MHGRALHAQVAVVNDDELQRYSDRRPLTFTLAYLLAQYSPRGRGWLPRAIGAGLGRNMKMILRSEHGARLAVDPACLDYFTQMLKSGGMVSRDVRDACLRVLRPGDVFYDVGAHVGMIANDIAAALRGEIHVVAFEPQPDLAHVAAVSARLNGFDRFRVFQVMLGRDAGTTNLFVAKVRVNASAVPRSSRVPRIKCAVYRLDDLVMSGEMPAPDVMKVDVEGGERDVFAGGSRTIAEHLPFIIFESDVNARRFGYTRSELIRDLKEMGPYEFMFISEGRLIPVGVDVENAAYSDLLAVPRTARGDRLTGAT